MKFFMTTFFIVKSSDLNMSERAESGEFNFEITPDNIVGPAFFESAGDAFNYAKEVDRRHHGNFFICRGRIDNRYFRDSLGAVLVGSVIKKIPAIVDEVTKISAS